jgi:hypothetical protein
MLLEIFVSTDLTDLSVDSSLRDMSTPEDRLGEFLQWTGWSRNKLAEKTETDPAYLYRILKGERRPNLAFAVAVERVTAGWPGGPIKAEEWVPRNTGSDPISGAA